jgi:hypothetical protein
MSRQKTLAELAMDKRLDNIERLLAKIYGEILYAKSAGKPGAHEIKKSCEEMLKGNVVPMKVLNSRMNDKRMNS